MRRSILVSAGEASGDLYAALVVEELRRIWPDADFFGCTGPRLRAAGVTTVVDAASLAVVGLVEVVAHLPRIHREYRKLLAAANEKKPDLAILADSPDFHLRVATRKGRLKTMRRVIRHLLCIFPFEQEFFERQGVSATYVGHPLAALVKPALARDAFFRKHGLDPARPLIAVLPGSRRGESARHLPALMDAAKRLTRERPVNLLLPASANTGAAFFRSRLGDAPIRAIEGESWDAMAHANLALAASGTVTVEAALLGTPMVTFYRVTAASWAMGRMLVNVPFYSMVNLIAGRAIVPELMQGQMTGERLAGEARRLLTDPAARERMQTGLREVREKLSGGGNAPRRAAAIIQGILEGQPSHVS
jgi:lipid-A-disaccharide synthase